MNEGFGELSGEKHVVNVFSQSWVQNKASFFCGVETGAQNIFLINVHAGEQLKLVFTDLT